MKTRIGIANEMRNRVKRKCMKEPENKRLKN